MKRLEKKNIITIEKQPPYAILKPTQKGRDIICHVHMHRDETIAQLSKDMNDEDKAIVIKLLNKMIINMEGES